MTKVSRSRYILCTPWDKPIEIDIYNWKDEGLFIKYWLRVFQEFEKVSSLRTRQVTIESGRAAKAARRLRLSAAVRAIVSFRVLSGLTFYLVWNHILVPDLPSYGHNVVAVLASDEECVIPPYVNKVRFVFKTIGFYPWCGASLREQSAASVLKCARDWTRWARCFWLFLRVNRFSLKQGRRMLTPMGYARQTDLPGKPFESRRYLVGFLGSIENKAYPKFSPKRLVATPKVIARSRMANSLQKLAAWAPESVFYGTTASFTETTMSGAGDRYTEIMADTKIALAPRGSSVETSRFFEAMRQGCIV